MPKIEAMRVVFSLVTVLFTALNGYCPDNNFCVIEERPSQKELILMSIMTVESGGCLNSFNEKEQAHGILQIRKPVLDDVNRYYGKNYSVNDAYIYSTAVEIFWLYQEMWKSKSLESISRVWNGGPNGVNKTSTLNYYRKVKNEFDRLVRNNSFKRIECKPKSW